MELRTVFTKKERLDQDQTAELLDDIKSDVDILIHDTSDMLDANELQQDAMLHPLDFLTLTAGNAQDATLTSFDSELPENGATYPEALL